jgi:hypothetical protein
MPGKLVPLLLVAILLACSAACRVEFKRVDGPPPIRGDASFGEVKLATELDNFSKKPIAEVSIFPSTATAIHATINVKNVPAGAEFRFVWKKGGLDAGMVVMSIPLDLHDNWVSGSIFPTGDVAWGTDWTVDVLYNGELVSSATFAVEQAAPLS